MGDFLEIISMFPLNFMIEEINKDGLSSSQLTDIIMNFGWFIVCEPKFVNQRTTTNFKAVCGGLWRKESRVLNGPKLLNSPCFLLSQKKQQLIGREHLTLTCLFPATLGRVQKVGVTNCYEPVWFTNHPPGSYQLVWFVVWAWTSNQTNGKNAICAHL